MRSIAIARSSTSPWIVAFSVLVLFGALLAQNAQGLESADTSRRSDGKVTSKLITGVGSYPGNSGVIHLFSKDHEFEARVRVAWPDYNEADGESRVAVGDIDGDGKDEVIIGLGSAAVDRPVPGGIFQILDDDFSHLAWGKINWPDYNAINGETWPSAADIDGDGKAEIIVGLGIGGEGRVELFDFEDGAIVHKAWLSIEWDDYNEVSGETRVAGGDLDGDGKAEIVVGFGPVAMESATPGGIFQVMGNDLRPLSFGRIEWVDYNTVNGESRPAVGDLDGDGKAEIVIGLGPGGAGRFQVFSYAGGKPVPRDWLVFNWPEYNDAYGETRPALGDVDSDGKAELFVGLGRGGDGWLELFDDSDNRYASLSSLQLMDTDYNAANGETWPAVAARMATYVSPSQEVYPRFAERGESDANVSAKSRGDSSETHAGTQSPIAETPVKQLTGSQTAGSGTTETSPTMSADLAQPMKTVSTQQVELAWDLVDGATQYRVEVNTSEDWSEATRVVYVSDLGITSSYEPLGLQAGVIYYWRVWSGNGTEWSDPAVGPSFSVTQTVSYTITASAGANGSISPSSSVSVPQGGSQQFTITPDPGYDIQDILINGSSMGPKSSYTFSNVSSDQTIEAVFAFVTPVYDLNSDGSVDISDIMIVASNWNKSSSDEDYNPMADINKDGRVDIVDIMMIGARWQQGG